LPSGSLEIKKKNRESERKRAVIKGEMKGGTKTINKSQ
jgi:hypothetical protein